VSFNETRGSLTVHPSTILVIGGVAMALVLLGIVLRSRPTDWPRQMSALLPGWPWW
jgi:hypothetical protein